MTVLLALALAATGDAAPLVPNGKWNLDYARDACRLSRDYGEGGQQITAVFERAGNDEGLALYLIGPDERGGASRGTASIRIEPQGITQKSYYEKWTTRSATPRGVVRTWLDNDGVAALRSATTLQILAGPVSASIAPTISPAAFSSLETCSNDLARSWGLDPGERDRVVVPAKASSNEAMWTTYADYPLEALRKKEQGVAIIAWTIGIDGRVHDCHTAVSSGSASLDAASCRALSTRGRYAPAIGKDGKPMETHQARRVSWSLPDVR